MSRRLVESHDEKRDKKKNIAPNGQGGIQPFESQDLYRTIRPQMRVLCTLKSSIKEELNYKVIHMHYEEYTGKK